MSPAKPPSVLQGDVDVAVARGDLAEAARLLELAVAGEDEFSAWFKLAGLRKALRQPRRALDAIHAALVHAPLDFVALAVRAGLLETLDPARAGEAWAEALAQRPEGDLPPAMVAAVTAGQALRDNWQADRAAKFAAAMATAETAAGAHS